MPQKTPWGQRIRRYSFLWLLAPAMVLYLLFIVYPLLSGLRYSLYNWDGVGPLKNYVGLENFVYLLTSRTFSHFVYRAIGHNLYVFGLTVILQLFFGLVVAFLLTRVRAARFFQTAYFIPYTLSLVVVGFLWGLLLQPQWGLVNQMLVKVGLGHLAQPWLGSPSLALLTIILVATWQGIAFPIMVFHAGIIGVPQEILESARVDGASHWQVFWRILAPLSLSTAVLLAMLLFIGSFGAFELIYIMQGAEAGPYYATDVLGTLFYRVAFGGMGATATGMGLASALAVLNAIIVTPISLVFVRFQRRFIYEY